MDGVAGAANMARQAVAGRDFQSDRSAAVAAEFHDVVNSLTPSLYGNISPLQNSAYARARHACPLCFVLFGVLGAPVKRVLKRSLGGFIVVLRISWRLGGFNS
jgi:hypothetical protein